MPDRDMGGGSYNSGYGTARATSSAASAARAAASKAAVSRSASPSRGGVSSSGALGGMSNSGRSPTPSRSVVGGISRGAVGAMSGQRESGGGRSPTPSAAQGLMRGLLGSGANTVNGIIGADPSQRSPLMRGGNGFASVPDSILERLPGGNRFAGVPDSILEQMTPAPFRRGPVEAPKSGGFNGGYGNPSQVNFGPNGVGGGYGVAPYNSGPAMPVAAAATSFKDTLKELSTMTPRVPLGVEKVQDRLPATGESFGTNPFGFMPGIPPGMEQQKQRKTTALQPIAGNMDRMDQERYFRETLGGLSDLTPNVPVNGGAMTLAPGAPKYQDRIPPQGGRPANQPLAMDNPFRGGNIFPPTKSDPALQERVPSAGPARPQSPSGFSQPQFGQQQYSPAQMYKNPETQGAALRSVVNNIDLLADNPRQNVDMMLKNMGYANDAGRAGIVGTWGHESMGYNPEVLNGNIQGDGGTAFGLGQWRFDRKDNAQNYLSAMDMPGDNLAGQAAFGGTELANKYPKAYDGVMSAQTPGQGVAAMHHYELPAGYKTFVKTGDPSVVSGWDDRLKRATSAYNAKQDVGPTVAPSPMSDSSGPVLPQGAAVPSSPSLWQSIQSGAGGILQNAAATGSQAMDQYQKANAAVNALPGSVEQKAAALKGFAKNGLLGGLGGYITGAFDDLKLTKPDPRLLNRESESGNPQRDGVTSKQIDALNTLQRAEYDRLIASGMTKREAFEAAQKFTTLPPPPPPQNNRIQYPTYQSAWAGLPTGYYA